MGRTQGEIDERRIADPTAFVGRSVCLLLNDRIVHGWNLRRVTDGGCVVTKGDHTVEHTVDPTTLLALNAGPGRSVGAPTATDPEEIADSAVRLLRTLGDGAIGPRLRRHGFDQIELDTADAGGALRSEEKWNEGFLYTDARPHDVDTLPALNMTSLGNLSGGRTINGVPDFYLWRVSQVHPRDVRGRVRAVLPYMVRYTVGTTTSNRFGKYVCGWHPGREKWVPLTPAAPEAAEGTATPIEFVRIGMGMHWNRQFEWRVLLGLRPDAPRLSMSTDPHGLKAIFRLRDVPEGKKRRAALRNWITEHWRRRRREDAAADIFVKQHLRGAQRFTWSGLECTLVPSPDETEAVKEKYKTDSRTVGRGKRRQKRRKK